MDEGVAIQKPARELRAAEHLLREGRFQRSLALLTAATSVISGLEVAYEHYRGSYSRRVMYTPVILSGLLALAGVAAFFSRRAARTVLRLTAAVTLADAAIGFYFHVRGIQRKPGGWRMPMTNMIMGPPVFAPLLFGTSAYLGLIASYLQRETAPPENPQEAAQNPASADEDTWLARILPHRISRDLLTDEQDVREGKFQQQVAIVTGVSALLSGFEAYYSHYKNGFRYWAQWTPIVLAPLLAGTAFGSVKSRRLATTALPALSVAASADAAVGFFYHARGVLRRPGGRKHLLYNIMYGPPIFAPLLFGAAGMLGLLGEPAAQEAYVIFRTKHHPIPQRAATVTDASLLPRDPGTGEALAPRPDPGYYPGYSTLSQAAYWDKTTRGVVAKRVAEPPAREFFTEAQWEFWTAVFDQILPQTDRTPERRVPIVAVLDHRLQINQTVGYRYEDMPHDREVYRTLGIEAIDAEARARFGGEFLRLAYLHRDQVLEGLAKAKPVAKAAFRRLPVHRFWEMLTADAVEAYYAHPYAWDEIGFGGPAYPRAYTRLERGEPEPWEVAERRYEWLAPAASVSDQAEAGDQEHQSHHGAGGTH